MSDPYQEKKSPDPQTFYKSFYVATMYFGVSFPLLFKPWNFKVISFFLGGGGCRSFRLWLLEILYIYWILNVESKKKSKLKSKSNCSNVCTLYKVGYKFFLSTFLFSRLWPCSLTHYTVSTGNFLHPWESRVFYYNYFFYVTDITLSGMNIRQRGGKGVGGGGGDFLTVLHILYLTFRGENYAKLLLKVFDSYG